MEIFIYNHKRRPYSKHGILITLWTQHIRLRYEMDRNRWRDKCDPPTKIPKRENRFKSFYTLIYHTTMYKQHRIYSLTFWAFMKLPA